MGKKKVIHVLSNTHWDREWRFPFQETRLLLIDLLDRLINLMEKKPEYKYFNFDSQTIFLEDYLEFRPENRERLAKLIEEGKLVVGPWYTLPEEFSVSGESLVRNLLMGRNVGDSLGKTSRVGYTPTSYGQISQIAQIYAGFDIDGIIFYRGINPRECTNEYFLEAPDGSRILGIRLSRYVSRGAFFIYITRRTMHPKNWMGYRWGEKGCLPFHLCRADEDHEEEPLLIRSTYKNTLNSSIIKEGVLKAMEDILAEATTDCLVLMDGMDSTYPNENVPEILKKANSVNSNWKFIHSSFPLFLKDLKSRINPEKLTVLKGERRHPSIDNMFNAFLKDSISSRLYIKQRNAEVERCLIKWAEPFSCLAWLVNHYEYPINPLLKAWKYLLSCHPHDSIGGLSPDQIHKDMMYRFDQAEIIGNALTKKALGEIVAEIDTSKNTPEDILITVFNPLSFECDAVPTVYIDFPREKEYRSFSIYDNKGKKVSQQIISRESSYLIASEQNEVPTPFYTTKWGIAFEAKKLPPLGFKTFTVRPEAGKRSNYGSQITGTNIMENEFLRVKIESNGTLTVTDKKTNQIYRNILYFEDAGEAGDPWMRIPPFADRIYNTLGCCAKIQLLEDGPILTTFSIKIKWDLPAGLDQASKQRTKEEKEVIITSKVSLQKEIPRIFIDVGVDNTIKNHRLRAMFDSGFCPDKSITKGQLDVIERPVHLPDTSDWLEPITGTNPYYGFVCVENGKRGLSTSSFGLTEFEVLDNEDGTIALTLLRTYAYPKMSGLGREDRVVRLYNEDSQCLGKNVYHLGLYFYKGKWQENDVLRQDYEYRYPPITVHHSCYPGKGLTKCESFFRIEPESLCLSTIKKSEKDNSMIIRLYNPTEKTIDGAIWSHFKIKKANLLKLSEDIIKDIDVEKEHTIKLKVPKKKIITIGLIF